ncbi:MAG: uroporphyrinogen-III C-methyltransferase [Gammaproteobacteria bacterium]|jgi:uroporphyrin-III C-methyltransferase/precorrin-2 dehydrogenase/sirohydrochlorin ferrochelatase|nr:uroporphyrinogen-III C-methyltransferase [Gammaproteobacteria bacterium]MBT3724538.1 uroporphyrinogen-III C-methyltransferase [Gammaproteobacteria bacterium]MBT4075930.1 uroporphyrinogen-III C-methyltransferase [Gammaproteobacteria bacterium]MBT4193173.1 uroporphyrinogen-III C-methyltransferase [Gammaproteobacteria bacterium]MBT4450308.1 uroporphyrinogen-III C-methyltransferase [Gammaproteobacteria bacterium]
MNYLPIFYELKDKACTVIGAGGIAARKADLLTMAGAKVTVISPILGAEMTRFNDSGKVEWLERPFQDGDLANSFLVIAATSDKSVNEQVAAEAETLKIPCNVVDNPGLCSFIMPSIINRDPVQIAVSTGGASPVLARLIRTNLESCTPSAYGKLATLVDKYRNDVKQTFPKVEERRKFWESILEGPVSEHVFAGRNDDARQLLEKLINEANADPGYKGEVFLVGAGPGDPDLLTFRALRLMQKADVIVYDRLVSDPIMDLVRRDAERIYAGKERSNHAIPQENINQLLVRLAKEGKRVLRLKGGDNFIFGRGGEEISELIDEDIPFQVVPGITAASGCTTYAGIPLTHRDYAQACIFVTGHLKDGTSDLNWEMLSHKNQTVVFYMGLNNVKSLCEELKKHGRDSKTPAALIEKGTTPDQRVFIGDLDTLAELVLKNDVKAPTLIVVGEVVELHNKLHWFKPGEEIK